MTVPAFWMVGGLVLAALEMIHPGAFLLWIGLAALGTGLAAELLGLLWHAQLAVFIVLALALVATLGVRLRRRTPDRVNAPTAGLLGQTCRAVAFQGAEGRVSLGDGTWYARLDAPGPAPGAGQALRVVGLDGTTLLVSSTEP